MNQQNDEMILEILEVGPFFVNCYIVGDRNLKKGAIIDPGYNADKIISFVERDNLTIDKIIITHGHVDHIGVLDEIRKYFKVPVCIGERDANMLTDPSANLSGMGGERLYTGPPEKMLHDGDVIEIGKYKFEVLETPGHTPGSISLYGNGVVFTGDALFLGSIGRTDFPGGSHETLLSSIENKLLVLPDDTIIYAGHGPDSTIGQEREFNPFLS